MGLFDFLRTKKTAAASVPTAGALSVSSPDAVALSGNLALDTVQGAGIGSEQLPAFSEDKGLRELNRSVRKIRDDREQFAEQFDRSLTKQGKQLQESFEGFQEELRRNMRDWHRETADGNRNGQQQLLDRIGEQGEALFNMCQTMSTEFGEQTEQVTQAERNVCGEVRKVGETSGEILTSTETMRQEAAEHTEKILQKLERYGKDAEVDKMTTTEHYRNLTLSVCALMLALFAAFLLVNSVLTVLKTDQAIGLSPWIAADFAAVFLTAAGALTLCWVQKRLFFGRCLGWKEYFKSDNPAHGTAHLACWIALATTALNLLLSVSAFIAFLISL